MSDSTHGVGQRRRPGRNAPDADGAEHRQRPASGGGERRGGPGGLQDLVGQQIVRDTLQGTGLGALSPLVASHMVLTQANIDPSVLGGASNREMQSNLRSGEAAGNGWGGALQGMTGPVPEFARERIETATGGAMGPIAGLPGSVPGVARHAIDAANDGSQQKTARTGTDPRDQKPRDEQDLGHVFGALSNLPEEQFDALLMDAGKQFLQGLGESGLYDLMDSMGLLPEADEEEGGAGDLGQGAEESGAASAGPLAFHGRDLARMATDAVVGGIGAVAGPVAGAAAEAAVDAVSGLLGGRDGAGRAADGADPAGQAGPRADRKSVV
jgi:hypothetical protein